MTTSLGTYLGTHLGTELGTGSDEVTELQLLELYLAKNLFSWMRADYRTEAASKVTAFQDKVLLPSQGGLAGNARSIDANHAFAQATGANQVAAITTDSAFGNKEAAAFTGAQFYASTLSALSWNFAHKLPAQMISVYKPTSLAANDMAWSTDAPTGPGAYQYAILTGTNTVQAQVTTTGASFINVVNSGSVGALVLNTPTFLDWSVDVARSPDAVLYQKSAQIFSGDLAASPSASDAAHTMTIGAIGTIGNAIHANITDIMFANYASATLTANARRYLLLRYGLS